MRDSVCGTVIVGSMVVAQWIRSNHRPGASSALPVVECRRRAGERLTGDTTKPRRRETVGASSLWIPDGKGEAGASAAIVKVTL
jgi:hypothetical protein